MTNKFKINHQETTPAHDENVAVTANQHSAPIPILLAGLALLLVTLWAHWRTVDSASALFQLKAGDVIYNDGQIPNRDIFSVGSRAGEWVFFEWLWAASLSAVYRAGDLAADYLTPGRASAWTAISALNVGLGLLLYGLTLARLRAKGGWLESLAITVIAAVALLPEFQPQAAYAVLPLYVFSLMLTDARRRWPLALLPPVMVLWANMHSSVLLALVAPVALLLFPPDKIRRRAYLLVIIIAGMLALLLTPNSVRVVPALVEMAQSQVLHAGARLQESWLQASAVVRAGAAVIFLIAAAAGRALDRRDGVSIVVLLVSTILFGLSSLNFLVLYLAGPAAKGLSRLLERPLAKARIRYLAGATVLFSCVAFAAVTALATRLGPQAWGSGIRPEVFPETAAGRFAALPLRATILNRPEHGGFLVWRLWPGWKVVADGRTALYEPGFFTQYEDIWQGGQGWQAFMSLWRVSAVLGDTGIITRYPAHNIYHELAASEDWVPVYWDHSSILYVKREIDLRPTNLEPFRQLKPGLPWPEMEERLATPQDWLEFKADLRRAMVDDPQNAVAAEFLKRADAAGF